MGWGKERKHVMGDSCFIGMSGHIGVIEPIDFSWKDSLVVREQSLAEKYPNDTLVMVGDDRGVWLARYSTGEVDEYGCLLFWINGCTSLTVTTIGGRDGARKQSWPHVKPYEQEGDS